MTRATLAAPPPGAQFKPWSFNRRGRQPARSDFAQPSSKSLVAPSPALADGAPSFSFGTDTRKALHFQTRHSFGPGPGAYALPTLRNQAAIKFGSAEREDAKKSARTPRALRAGMARSPPDAFAPRAPGCPRAPLGAVFHSPKLAKQDPTIRVSPGPSAYSVQSSTFGSRRDPRLPNGQGSAFPRTLRPYEREPKRVTTTPGPGEYGEPTRSIGRQLESRSLSSARAAFTTGGREPSRLISKRHERELICTQGPGPCLYESPSALGAQAASRKPTQPAFSFGTTARFHEQGARKAVRGMRRAPSDPPECRPTPRL